MDDGGARAAITLLPRAGHSLEKNKFSAKKSRHWRSHCWKETTRGSTVWSCWRWCQASVLRSIRPRCPRKEFHLCLQSNQSPVANKEERELPLFWGWWIDRWRGHTCDGSLFVQLLSIALISLPVTQWLCLNYFILNVITKDLSEWFLRRISHQGPCMFDHQTPPCSATAAAGGTVA